MWIFTKFGEIMDTGKETNPLHLRGGTYLFSPLAHILPSNRLVFHF